MSDLRFCQSKWYIMILLYGIYFISLISYDSHHLCMFVSISIAFSVRCLLVCCSFFSGLFVLFLLVCSSLYILRSVLLLLLFCQLPKNLLLCRFHPWLYSSSPSIFCYPEMSLIKAWKLCLKGTKPLNSLYLLCKEQQHFLICFIGL